MTSTRKLVRMTLTTIGLLGFVGLSACSTTPTSEADRKLVQKAERIADRIGNRNMTSVR